MRRNSAWFAPRLLSDDQKAVRVCVCRKLKQQARDDPSFISNIITGVELWVYGYEPETKQQVSQWKSPNSPRPKKEREVRSNINSMLIVFFDIQVIVHKDFVPPGQTVNGKFYCEVVKRLMVGIRRTRTDKLKKSNWFLQHDNAPAFTSFVVDNSWLPKTLQRFPTPLFTWIRACDFSYSPRWIYGWKGVVFTRLRRSTQKRKRLSTHSYLSTSEMHEIMGNTLGSLCTRPRWVLRRRQWELGVTIRNLFG